MDVQEVDGEHERDAGQIDDDVAAQFLLLRAVGHHRQAVLGRESSSSQLSP